MHYVILLFLAFCLPITFVSAQTGLDYGELKLTIDLEPAYPEPEGAFTAIVNDYALPIPGSGIRWFVDGELVTSALNERELALTAKKIGQKTELKLVIDYPGGTNLTVERTIEPVYFDVVIEPQTRVPAFYKGRPLPSVGSIVNASAFLNGNAIEPKDLMYTWRLNNKVVEGGAVRGKNVITFPMPQGLFANLSVEVRTPEGEPLARKIFDIIKATPTVSFYEVSNLYGLRQKTAKESLPLLGSSLAVRAEPYFLDLSTYNQPDHLEWKINGTKTPNSNKNPYEVTLAIPEEGSSSGINRIDFHVRNTVQLLQGAQGTFQVSY